MWFFLFLAFFVFMITYDPKSGTLNKYIPNSPEEKKENVVQKPLMLTRGAYARPSK